MPFSNLQTSPTPSKLIYTLIYLLPLLLASCSMAAPTPTPEPITIAFSFGTDGGGDTDEAYYQKLAQEFQQSHPHITIKLSGIEYLDIDHTDVLIASSFTLMELQEQAEILSLTPFIQPDKSLDVSDFYPGALALYTGQGKTWAIPAGMDPVVMFYNQDLFDQYGAPYPEIGWTRDDFLASALAVSDPEAGVFGYGPIGYDPNRNSIDLLIFINQHGGRIFDDLQNPTRSTFDNPLTIEAVEWYAGLMHKHDVAPTPTEARQAFSQARYSIYRGILTGKVAMWMGGLSEKGGQTWPMEWFMRWGMVPLPRDAQPANIAFVDGYAISAKTKHPRACWQWISFLSQQIPNHLAPARRSLAESDLYEQQVGKDVAAVTLASIENTILVSPQLAEFEQALEIFSQAVNEIVDNEAAIPEEVMSRAQREAESRVAQ